MARISLEDNFTDILGKAQGGLGLGDAELARRAGVTVKEIAAAKDGHVDEAVLRKLAAALNLGANALVASAKQAWYPKEPGDFITQTARGKRQTSQAGTPMLPGSQAGTPVLPGSQAGTPMLPVVEGLACFNTPFSEMTVNAYLVFDPQTRAAAAFDTSTDCDAMLAFIRERGLKVELILLTHAHGDHVYELDRLKEATGAKACISERETIPGVTRFADGHEFELGKKQAGSHPNVTFEARRTSGHARGGTTFVVTGLSRRLAIVGDALFAGSMGGGMVNYAEALRTNRESIFTLPDDTVICPGHGPLTTVGEEKAHNPFYP